MRVPEKVGFKQWYNFLVPTRQYTKLDEGTVFTVWGPHTPASVQYRPARLITRESAKKADNKGYEIWAELRPDFLPSSGKGNYTVQDFNYVLLPWTGMKFQRVLCPAVRFSAGLRFNDSYNLFMPPMEFSGDHSDVNKIDVNGHGHYCYFGYSTELPYWSRTWNEDHKDEYQGIDGADIMVSIPDLLKYNSDAIKTLVDGGEDYPHHITGVATRVEWDNDATGKGDGPIIKGWFYPAGLDECDFEGSPHQAQHAVIPCGMDHMSVYDWSWYGNPDIWNEWDDGRTWKAGQYLYTNYIFESSKPLINCSYPEPTYPAEWAYIQYFCYNGTGSDIDLDAQAMWITGFDPTKKLFSDFYGAYTVSISDGDAVLWRRDGATFQPVQVIPTDGLADGDQIGGVRMKLMDAASRSLDYGYLESSTAAGQTKEGQFWGSSFVGGDRSIRGMISKFRNQDGTATTAGYVISQHSSGAWNVSKTLPSYGVAIFLP